MTARGACCRHELRLRGHRVEYAPGVESPYIDHDYITKAPILSVLVDANVCDACGAWLSLGESRDDSDDSELEIDAARIAQSWRDNGPTSNPWFVVEVAALACQDGEDCDVCQTLRLAALAHDATYHNDPEGGR